MKRIQFEGVTHQFPDDFTDAEIQQALSGSSGADAVAYNPRTAFGMPRPAMDMTRMAGRALDAGPGIGMALGSIAGTALGGPVGGFEGAALGGMAGESGRQLGRRALGIPTPPAFSPPALARLGSAGKMGLQAEAFGQGGANLLEGAMGGLPRLQGGLAQSIQAGALNPGKQILAEDRGVVRNSLREGVPISGSADMAGTNEMTKRLRASHAAEDEIAAAAGSTWRKQPSQVMDEMEARIRAQAPRNKRLTVADSPEWKKMREDFLDSYAEPVPPQYAAGGTMARGAERPFDVFSALQTKRAADKASFAARQAVEKAQIRPTNQGQDVEELFNRELGDVLRQDLRNEVKGLGRQMQKTKELMPLEHAYLQAESRSNGIGLGEGGVFKNMLRPALAPAPMSRRAMSLYGKSVNPRPPLSPLAMRGLPYLFNYQPPDSTR